ncbi:MAG: alpha/beta hydrolase [Neisseria sp.]|nr:alpha/beta hydrolase [Neisseria sp.]
MTLPLFQHQNLPLTVNGVALDIAAIHRQGTRAPVLFLHGFGSSKEDYADWVLRPEFADCPFIAYDAPGCGGSGCADLGALSIPFLQQTALAVLDYFQVGRFHLVGHSMGGLTALLLAAHCGERVLSFTNIEGNIAPEDCFLSRQIVDFADDDPQVFFDRFIERTRQSPAFSSALYAASLKHKVRVEAVKPIFTSMVDLSDHGGLMDLFLGLSCPKMLMYGEQNAHLSYLGYIESHGVRLSEVPHCGHFPMYANPDFMWREIAAFHRQAV